MKTLRWIAKVGWSRPFKCYYIVHLSLIVVAWAFSNKLIFVPPAPQYDENSSDLVLLDRGEEQVACFYYPPANDEKVLLWAHGNAEDIGNLKPLLAEFHRRGIGVLGYDYPGYGHSAGAPSEGGCYRAAKRAYDFLTREQSVEPQRIIVLGQSVGTGSACWLAEREEVGGLVLISPFLSAFRSLTHIPLIPGDKFKNLQRIKRIKAPLLVIHGTIDEVIPYRQGVRIHREHAGPKEFLEIPGAGHNDIWLRGREEMISAIMELNVDR